MKFKITKHGYERRTHEMKRYKKIIFHSTTKLIESSIDKLNKKY